MFEWIKVLKRLSWELQVKNSSWDITPSLNTKLDKDRLVESQCRVNACPRLVQLAHTVSLQPSDISAIWACVHDRVALQTDTSPCAHACFSPREQVERKLDTVRLKYIFLFSSCSESTISSLSLAFYEVTSADSIFMRRPCTLTFSILNNLYASICSVAMQWY